MSNVLQACVTIPGQPKIHSSFQQIQDSTLLWAQKFELVPQFKPLKWYTKARFGLQAAREYPDATLEQINLAGDLLTWLFTVDDTCDRGSSDAAAAKTMGWLLDEFIDILAGKENNSCNSLSIALKDILSRFSTISSPFLYRQYCVHMTDYLNECRFEIKMQLDGYLPSIEKYYRERPFTGFYIMFPLVGIFEGLDLPDEVYSHPAVKEIELYLNLLGCLSNDLHSIDREGKLDATGFNLILIAKRELRISLEQAVEFTANEHAKYLQRFELCRQELPYWGPGINEQLDRYIQGLYTIVRGYDDWAVIDTGRYQSIA